MTRFNSRDSFFSINDSGGTARDLSNFITEIDGLPGERELAEVTALGDSGRTYIPSLQNAVITLAGIFDDSVTSGPDSVLGLLVHHTGASTFFYGPKGGATDDTGYGGAGFVRTYTLGSRIGESVTWRAEIQVSGTVTRSTGA